MNTVAPANLLVLGIRGYQRFVSPYKGYGCSHRALHGRGSCSDHGLRLLRDRRLRAFVPLMRRRFAKCHAAGRTLMRNRALAPEFHPDFAGGPHRHEELDRRRRCGRFWQRATDREHWKDACCHCAPVDCAPDCTPDCSP